MMLAGRQRLGRARSAMAGDVHDPERARRFREAALPHLDEVYTLARYLLRNAADADDAVQECYLRALKHFDTFRGGAIRPWLFAILRNTCKGVSAHRGLAGQTLAEDAVPLCSYPQGTPEARMLRRREEQSIREMVSALPGQFRETIVLREINGLSHSEIAEIAGVPIGT